MPELHERWNKQIPIATVEDKNSGLRHNEPLNFVITKLVRILLQLNLMSSPTIKRQLQLLNDQCKSVALLNHDNSECQRSHSMIHSVRNFYRNEDKQRNRNSFGCCFGCFYYLCCTVATLIIAIQPTVTEPYFFIF